LPNEIVLVAFPPVGCHEASTRQLKADKTCEGKNLLATEAERATAAAKRKVALLKKTSHAAKTFGLSTPENVMFAAPAN
jgi:hypothetical protein